MAALGFDISNPQIVSEELAEANRRLARAAVVPDSVLALVAEIAESLSEVPTEARTGAGVDPEAWIGLQNAALRAFAALQDDDERRQRRQLRLLIDEMRFRVDRIAEQERFADERSAEEVLRWLDGRLTVSQAQKAGLVGVSDRTWQRWLSESQTAAPSGEDERRLRMVARAVSDLGFVLTAGGAVKWLQAANAQLDGAIPIEIIERGDPAELAGLFSTIRQARAGTAA